MSTVLWQRSLMLLLPVPVRVRVARAFVLLFCFTFFCVQVFLWISHNSMLLTCTTHFGNCLLFLTFSSLHDCCSEHDCILSDMILKRSFFSVHDWSFKFICVSKLSNVDLSLRQSSTHTLMHFRLSYVMIYTLVYGTHLVLSALLTMTYLFSF